MPANDPPVPLTLLTGFLGAGKTTVLNRVITAEAGLKVAVMVNDFGDLDIDDELVVSRDGRTLRLTNGCICCSLKEGLVAAVMEVLSGPERPDHILLEASGVADPTGIATTLLAPVFEGRIRLDGVICVVDVGMVAADHPEQDLLLRQLMVSDLVLLNKTDTVDADARAAAVQRIRSWLRQARILETVNGDAPLAVLLSTLRDGQEGFFTVAPDALREKGFATWQYDSGEPMDPQRLAEAVANGAQTVYRVKGVVLLPGEPRRVALVQGVGRRVAVSPLERTPTPDERSRLLVIGRQGALDGPTLQTAFDACRVS